MNIEWVKTSEALPDYGVNVLIAIKLPGIDRLRVTQGYRSHTDENDEHWKGAQNRPIINPYCWAELPEPPELPK